MQAEMRTMKQIEHWNGDRMIDVGESKGGCLQLCIHSKTSFVVTSLRGRHLGTLPPAIVAFAVTVALVFWRMWGGSGRRSGVRSGHPSSTHLMGDVIASRIGSPHERHRQAEAEPLLSRARAQGDRSRGDSPGPFAFVDRAQRAWKAARTEIVKMPSVNDHSPDRESPEK